MKKILMNISILLVTLHDAKAQQIQVQDTPPDWAFMMSNLNTAQITSGILYNKVAMFSGLYDYNRGKYNLSHADHFMQAINELHYASEQTQFMPAKQLKATIATTPSATVDIGIINTTIHQLNFNEKDPATGGLTFANGKFVPITGQPSFLSRKILLASPLKEMATGTAVTYQFSNALIYNNCTTAIKNLVVYFDDATPITVISNSVLVVPSKTVNYSTSGNKMIKFEATFSDNTSITTVGYHYFSYASLRPVITARTATITDPSIACSDDLKERGIYKSTIEFQGYDEPTGYYGKFDYTIFYHTLNNPNKQKKMLRPILVVDGFDPGDTRKTTDCDCEQDTSEGGCFQKNSIKSFVFNGGLFPTLQLTFNPATHESIEDNMLYKDINPISGLLEPTNLIVKLRSEGYDVIILNIPKYKTSAVGSAIENKDIDGGGDYVERNGRTLASYIKSVKATLTANGSNEGLVIMGPSMGGLISRYALAYMEKKFAETNDVTWKHNTRIWVSFDSPHLGANIPMGAQANIWFFGFKLRNVAAEDKFNNQLNSTAGKQLLINQFSNTLATLSNGTGSSGNSPFFTRFYSDLNNNGVPGSGGFPVSIPGVFRKIAIVNGSLAGVKNGTEGGEFLNIRGYKDPTITEGLISGAIAGSVVPFVGTFAGAVFGGLLGASNANVTVLRIRDKFYPAYGQTDDVFNGDGQNFTIGWSQWYINHKWYNLKGTNNDIRGSLDIVPAGTFATNKIIKDEIVKGLEEKGFSSEIRGTNIDSHSFIPAFSSLAHLQPNQSWANPLNTNLTCSTNKQTPFDSYFGANLNSGHVTLTKDMVNWLLEELKGNPQAPSFPTQANLLTGANVICLNTNTAYQLDACKVPSPATWAVSPNLQIVNTIAGYVVTVKGIVNGAGTITGTFQDGQKIVKNVWVGAPILNLVRDSGERCDSKWHYVTYIINSSPESSISIDYLNPKPLGIEYGLPASGSYNTITFKYGKGFSGNIGFGLIATNICDSFGVDRYENVKLCSQLQTNAARTANITETIIFKIFPNPSSNVINISLFDETLKPSPQAQITAKLYDINGLEKRSLSVTNNTATVNVSTLPKGIYVLKINIDGVIESHQVVVE
jgi:Secretion system C-terminal sorting domain/Putative serine esterase (DUF676)